jgi:hypothetical protein
MQTVSGILRRQFSLPTVSNGLGSTTQIQVIGVDPATIQDVREFVMSDGRFLQPDDSGQAVLPAGIAELAPELTVGTTFPLITAGGLKLYTVVGLLSEQGDLSAPQLYVTLADAQGCFQPARPHQYGGSVLGCRRRSGSSCSGYSSGAGRYL